MPNMLRKLSKNAALLQIIANELEDGSMMSETRRRELGRALNRMATELIARPERAGA